MTAGPAVRHVLEAYYGVEQSPEDPHPTGTEPSMKATQRRPSKAPPSRPGGVGDVAPTVAQLASLPKPPSPVMFEVGLSPCAIRPVIALALSSATGLRRS
jgi:hypothetical protein